MEYPDAPSGSVMLYNYKEPFMRYDKGYGYQGVLLFDVEDDKVQCHLCGEWFAYLPNHLHREHSTSAREYKEMVGLSQTTALIGEAQRAKLIETALGRRTFKNLRPGVAKTEAEKQKIRETLKKLTVERQNKLGTCPAQLIEKLRNKYHKLGRTPSEKIDGFQKETYERVFGSWKEACARSGIPYVRPGVNRNYDHVRKSAVVESEVILWIRDSIVDGKLPKQSDYAKRIAVHKNTVYSALKRYGGWRKLCHEALLSAGEMGGYKKVAGYRYSKVELLGFLTNFAKHNGRNPAVSDCKRGLLPHASRYIYYWGGWKQALKAANL